MKKRLAFVLSAFCILHSAFAAAATRPDLIVVVSIDQFRYDYLDRFGPWFSERGFNRFLKNGANFSNAYYRHANTFTGPGHASIGTGRTPGETGIVGNTWFERTSRDEKSWQNFFEDSGGYAAPNPPQVQGPAWYETITGAPRYCVEDPRVVVSAGTTGGMSPVALAEDALGDRLRETFPQSRVMSVAIKDRAAILMGGRKADAVYWFDPDLPGFISSNYYRYDPALFAFNQTATRYLPSSGQWTLSGTIAAEAMKRVTFDPPDAWPFKNSRYGTHFDHPVASMRALTYTPFANDMLLDFAARIVDVEGLGTRGTPDLLFVGISSPDYLGHYYGPDSMEVAEDAVLLDRSLQRFVDGLDAKFHDRLLVAITADHGVQSTPEIARLKDPTIDAGRLDFRNPRKEAHLISELPPQRIEIERALANRLQAPFAVDAPLSQALVAFFEEPSLYLNWDRVAVLKLDGEQVKRALRDVALAIRGVNSVFTNSELMTAKTNPSDVERAVRASFRADRSGDVLVELKKNWIWSYGNPNTTHGQPLPDDQHVPLMLWGAAVRPARYEQRVSPIDIARTLGALFGFDAGGPDAQVLPCIDERQVVLATALAQLEHGQQLTLVVPDGAPADVRSAAAALRNVVSDAPELPAGYARLDALEVNGNKGTVRLWTGPIPKPQPGVLSMNCGTGHIFNLVRDANGVWRITSQGVVQC